MRLNVSLLGGALFALALSGSAEAAVTVVGPGPAQLCFTGAEQGGDPLRYSVYCDVALAGALTDHDRAATYINRGVLKLAMGRAEDALSDFNAGLGVDATLGDGYVDRAAALIRQKQFDQARADIDKGLSLGPRQPEVAYYDRAICDESLGDIPGAYKDYRQALTIAPGFALASEELKRFKVVSDGNRNGT